MRRCILLFLLVAPLSLIAEPRIAVVDMDAVYRGYARKVDLEKQLQERLAQLQNSSGHEAVRKMDTQLQELAQRVRNKNITVEEREQAAAKFNSLAREHQALLKNVSADFQRSRKKATEGLVTDLEELIAEIRIKIARIGEEEKFDLVLENAGHTSTQISPLIYIRHKTDITELVLERLNQSTKPAAQISE